MQWFIKDIYSKNELFNLFNPLTAKDELSRSEIWHFLVLDPEEGT